MHGVFKDTSTTTKVRPVFDASARTSSGHSLNDQLLAGPNLYPAITDMLLQFRVHPIALSADIGKMFREIYVAKEDRDLHRFLYRDPSGAIQDCRMKRLTFGIKSSPFLATKVLLHHASTHRHSYPLASRCIENNFYVDDLLSGADSVEEARESTCNLLMDAAMSLRKLRTNLEEFRATIPEHLQT